MPAPPVDPARVAYQRASALATRIVARTTVLPRAIEQFEELVGVYSIRFHFGSNLEGGRGVLEIAALADTPVLQEQSDPTGLHGVFVETRAALGGVNIIARALLSVDDAARLHGDPAPATSDERPAASSPPMPAAEPVPLGASVIAVVPVVAAADGAQ
ncbi:hypothetical protein B0675_02045 [Streptomyces sp. M41(2017)]|nr:hypothetical protein B0675_02045 [Streptomyces sp. M41(2017)]